MSHDVKITQPNHFIVQRFEVVAVGFFPILALVVSSIEWICVINVVDGCDYLVELIVFQKFTYLLMAVLI